MWELLQLSLVLCAVALHKNDNACGCDLRHETEPRATRAVPISAVRCSMLSFGLLRAMDAFKKRF